MGRCWWRPRNPCPSGRVSYGAGVEGIYPRNFASDHVLQSICHTGRQRDFLSDIPPLSICWTSLTLNILEPSEKIILNTGLNLIDYTKLKFKLDNELVTVNWTVNGTVKTGDILNSEYKLVSDNGNNLKLMKK